MQRVYGLDRYLEAQAGIYPQVLDELRAGRKRSHWMWFVFPQFDGLGVSTTSRFYAIKSLAEARARLIECTRIVNAVQDRSVHEIFGSPDDLKFRSSMTLFELVAGPDSEFAAALDKYFAGERDDRTLALVDPDKT